MKWFKHDSDAGLDAKLMKVRLKYGMEGYGVYWYLLEKIVGNIDSHNLTFELEHDSEILAHETGIHVDRINEMMAFMANLGLFESSDGTITCLKIAKRLDQSMTSNPALRKKIKHIHEAMPDKVFKLNHDPVMTQSCHSHDSVMQEEKRIEEKRVDKKKKAKKKVFTPPSLEEVRQYAKERNSNVNAKQFFDYFDTGNWTDSRGNKVKNWKQKFISWDNRDNKQPKQQNVYLEGGKQI